MVPRIALLSTSDTDLLSARASGADYVLANPARAAHTELAAVLEACDLIVARILGSPQMLCSGFDWFRATGKPMVVLGGEQAPDAALMELSTVPLGVAADAHAYLAPSDAFEAKDHYTGVGMFVRKLARGFFVTEVVEGSARPLYIYADRAGDAGATAS